MKSRSNPIYAYFKTSVRDQINCEEQNDRKHLQACERHLLMSNQLLLLVKRYEENEERIKVNQALENESYNDCLNFRDHAMEREICRWPEMFRNRYRKLAEEQKQLEAEAREMLFHPS